MSDIQSGVFYPLSTIFGLFPFPFSLNLFILVHIFLAGLFFYLFIRDRGHSENAALITTLSYAFGGYTLSSINVLNNLTTLVWLPAVMWSYQRTVDNNSMKFFFLTAFCLCCAILGGEPQLFILIAGLLVLSCLMFPDKRPWPLRMKTSVSALFLIILAIGITLFQIGPTYTDYLYSVRLDGIPFKEAIQNSLHFETLKHLILPLIFPADFTTDPASLSSFFPESGRLPWLLSLYPGFIIVPLAIAGLFGAYFRNTLYWFIIFCIAVLLALGGNTPFYSLFYKIFPIFRFPEKFIFVCNFSLLVIAAHGVDTVIGPLQRIQIRPVFVTMLLISTLATDLFISHRYLNPVCSASAYYQYHSDLKPVVDDTAMFRIFVDTGQGPDTVKPQTILDHHAKWQLLMMPNLGLLHDLSHVGGKTGMELKYQYFITEILSKSWPEKITFLKMANVKYIVSTHPLEKEPALAGRIEKINPSVYLLKENLPRAWLVGRVLATKGATLSDFVKYSFDPARSAMGAVDVSSRHSSPDFSTVDKIEYPPGNRISIQVDAKRPSVLVLSESAYPGWKVYVDGVEKDLLWLNLFFQGVEINKGHHKIEFVFYPENFSLFLALSVVSFIILMIAGFVFFKPSPKELI